MSVNNSINKPTQEEEAELARLNEELQKAEAENDELCTKVNDYRQNAPTLVFEWFGAMKEARLQKLAALNPEHPENSESAEQISSSLSAIQESAQFQAEEAELQDDLERIEKIERINRHHEELLYSGLSDDRNVILPEARCLMKIADFPELYAQSG